MKVFNFRDKKEIIGVVLGTICFLPSFLIVLALGMVKPMIAVTTLIITQCLWLTSMWLCCWSLEMENYQLKQQIKNKEEI